MNSENKIFTFTGPYRFLSNFYPAPFVWDDILWPTSEHAYQAAKTLDKKTRLEICKLSRPGEAKRAGKRLALREDWHEVKIDIMYQVVFEKFYQNPDLRSKLIATGSMCLEEGNTWNDVFWGVCPPGSSNGRNELGKILMKIRKHFITTEK